MDFRSMSDAAIVRELGERVRRQRLNGNITQAMLAEKAGVGRTVVQKFEKGSDTTLGSLLRMVRALGVIEQVDAFLPEPGISPLQLARLQGLERQRASGRRGRVSGKGRS